MLLPVRDFYILGEVDGYKNYIRACTHEKNEGIFFRVFMRNGREMWKVLTFTGIRLEDGALRLRVEIDGDEIVIVTNKGEQEEAS